MGYTARHPCFAAGITLGCSRGWAAAVLFSLFAPGPSLFTLPFCASAQKESFMARLSDYKNITLESQETRNRNRPKSGCGIFLFLLVAALLACVVAVLYHSWQAGRGALAPSTGAGHPGPAVEETTPAGGGAGTSPAAPAAQEADDTPPRVAGNPARMFTFTVRVSVAARVRITQKNDGKVLLDEVMKPHLPLNLTGRGPLSVMSDHAAAVRITVGGEKFMLPPDAGADVKEFEVRPATD
jgi:hypothetical protein